MCFGFWTYDCNLIAVWHIDPNIVFFMVVEEVDLHFLVHHSFSLIFLLLLFSFNHSSFQPSSYRMIHIHSIIQFDLLSRLPLPQNPWRSDGYWLIIFRWESRIMNIDGAITDKSNFSIHPLIDRIKNIKVLSNMKPLLFSMLIRVWNRLHLLFYIKSKLW